MQLLRPKWDGIGSKMQSTRFFHLFILLKFEKWTKQGLWFAGWDNIHMGCYSSWVGGKLHRGICANERGFVHDDRSEVQEDGVGGGGDSQDIQESWRGEDCDNCGQFIWEEEEIVLQIQGQEGLLLMEFVLLLVCCWFRHEFWFWILHLIDLFVDIILLGWEIDSFFWLV